MKGIKIFLLLFSAWNLHAQPLYHFDNPASEAQFHHLLKELRCLVCQNQDLADSNASLANDLRQQVYMLVQAKKSEADIRAYLIERYGEFIVFKPSFRSLTWGLWLGPALFLIGGLFLFGRFTKRKYV